MVHNFLSARSLWRLCVAHFGGCQIFAFLALVRSIPSPLAIGKIPPEFRFLKNVGCGEHFCGSVITHYDTFILRLQSIVGSPRGKRGMRLLREPLALAADDTNCIIRLRTWVTMLSPQHHCAAPLPPTVQGAISPRLTIDARSADRHRWGRGMRGICDGCDDCDGIFDTGPAVRFISSQPSPIVTAALRCAERITASAAGCASRYIRCRTRSAALPAFTLSCRVRMLGCISSFKQC